MPGTRRREGLDRKQRSLVVLGILIALREVGYFFRVVRLGGTLAPALRASDNPMAIACLRLLTFFPERPLRSFPDLRSCIARFTF